MIDFNKSDKYVYHLTDKDIERINKPLKKYEDELRKKRKIRRYVWALLALILVIIIILWRFNNIEIPFLSEFKKVNLFTIKKNISLGEAMLKIRISKYEGEKLITIIEVYNNKSNVKISILNGNEKINLILTPIDNIKSILFIPRTNFINVEVNGKTEKINNIEKLKELK